MITRGSSFRSSLLIYLYYSIKNFFLYNPLGERKPCSCYSCLSTHDVTCVLQQLLPPDTGKFLAPGLKASPGIGERQLVKLSDPSKANKQQQQQQQQDGRQQGANDHSGLLL